MKKIIPIFIIVVLLIGAGAFYGGMLYSKSQGGIGNFHNFNGQRPGNNVRANGAGQGFTNGEILSADDKSVTVKLPDGGSKIIFFSGTTEISKSVTGVPADLTAGLNVMASGTTNSDGSITAKTIQIRPNIPTPDQPQASPVVNK